MSELAIVADVPSPSSESAKAKKKLKDVTTSFVPHADLHAQLCFGQLLGYVKRMEGLFLRGDDGSLHVIVDGRRIPLAHGADNYALAELMLKACGMTTTSNVARGAIQRLQVHATKQENSLQIRHFAAASSDLWRLYVAADRGQVLRITPDEIEPLPNGDLESQLWLEHPNGQPFIYSRSTDPKADLAHFERLVVDTQACEVAEMRWLVAMHEGFFPYLRDLSVARILVLHIGGSQQGKTSGAQRYTLLHGLGSVKGDYTVAALGNMADPGLLVLDNKEHANLTRELIDYLLFLATGAERARSSADGATIRKSQHRPVGVITSIEGVWKPELKKRCIEVKYQVNGQVRLGRVAIEKEIGERRHDMLSAMMVVLQQYLKLKRDDASIPTPNPIPAFEEYFTLLADLLRAYADVTRRPREWCESIIQAWARTISDDDSEDNALEDPILRILRCDSHDKGAQVTHHRLAHKGQSGTLYVTTTSSLLTGLQRINIRELQVPKSPGGLKRRLKDCQFHSFEFLDTDTRGIAALKRTSSHKRIGFFVPDDDMTQADDNTKRRVILQPVE